MLLAKTLPLILALLLTGCGHSSGSGPSVVLRLQPKAGTTYVYTTVTTATPDLTDAGSTEAKVTTTRTIKILESDGNRVKWSESSTFASANPELSASPTEENRTYSSLYGAERGQTASMYPKRAVRVGDNWDSLEPGSDDRSNFTLEKIETKGAKQYATLRKTFEVDQSASPSGTPIGVKVHSTTDYVVDVATGMFVSSVTTAESSTTIFGKTTFTTTIAKMTLDRVE